MDQRREFVMLAKQEGVNLRKLCRQFGISAPTAYKWIERYDAGDTRLADRSRRPHHSPDRTAAAVEQQIVALRDAHPAWGARKLAQAELDLARSQVSVLLAQMNEGRASLRQLEEARFNEDEKWIALYDAQFNAERARLNVLRQTGQLATLVR